MTITLKHNKEEFFSVLKKGGQRGRIGENLREIQKKKVKSLRKKKIHNKIWLVSDYSANRRARNQARKTTKNSGQ